MAISQEAFMSWASTQAHLLLAQAGDQDYDLAVFSVPDTSFMI